MKKTCRFCTQYKIARHSQKIYAMDEEMKTAILECCYNSAPSVDFEDGIGCCKRGVECDCFCGEARTIENMLKTGYRKASEVKRQTIDEIYKLIRQQKAQFTEWQWMVIDCIFREVKKNKEEIKK